MLSTRLSSRQQASAKSGLVPSPPIGTTRIELASFFGDMVNDYEFAAASRRPDPQRMVRSYNQAAATLNLLRAFTKGGVLAPGRGWEAASA